MTHCNGQQVAASGGRTPCAEGESCARFDPAGGSLTMLFWPASPGCQRAIIDAGTDVAGLARQRSTQRYVAVHRHWVTRMAKAHKEQNP